MLAKLLDSTPAMPSIMIQTLVQPTAVVLECVVSFLGMEKNQMIGV